MSVYSLFTHGNALEVQTPLNLAGFGKFGWGAEINFKDPSPQYLRPLDLLDPFETFDDVGPGSWFHLPLPLTAPTWFGRESPQLVSVTLLFETSHCRIKNVHVWDGASLVHEFNGLSLKGTFLWSRAPSLANTLELPRPYRVFSAIGLSFFACAHLEDFRVNGHYPPSRGPYPPAILTVSAGGGKFVVRDQPVVYINLRP